MIARARAQFGGILRLWTLIRVFPLFRCYLIEFFIPHLSQRKFRCAVLRHDTL